MSDTGQPMTDPIVEELKRLANLREVGILTAEEFEAQKAAFLRANGIEPRPPTVAGKSAYARKGCAILPAIVIGAALLVAAPDDGGRNDAPDVQAE